MSFLVKLVGYLFALGGPVVGAIVGKHTDATTGAAAGTVISGVGGRILHNSQPPK